MEKFEKIRENVVGIVERPKHKRIDTYTSVKKSEKNTKKNKKRVKKGSWKSIKLYVRTFSYVRLYYYYIIILYYYCIVER